MIRLFKAKKNIVFIHQSSTVHDKMLLCSCCMHQFFSCSAQWTGSIFIVIIYPIIAWDWIGCDVVWCAVIYGSSEMMTLGKSDFYPKMWIFLKKLSCQRPHETKCLKIYVLLLLKHFPIYVSKCQKGYRDRCLSV